MNLWNTFQLLMLLFIFHLMARYSNVVNSIELDDKNYERSWKVARGTSRRKYSHHSHRYHPIIRYRYRRHPPYPPRLFYGHQTPINRYGLYIPYRPQSPYRPYNRYHIPYRFRSRYRPHSIYSSRRFRIPVFLHLRHGKRKIGYRRYSYKYRNRNVRLPTQVSSTIRPRPQPTIKTLQRTSAKQVTLPKSIMPPQHVTTLQKITANPSEQNTTYRPTAQLMTTAKQTNTTITTTKTQPSCHEGSTTLDACQRICVCQDGKLTECYRVRKEFTYLSTEEKQRYQTAVVLVSTLEPYKNKYEKLVTLHKTLFEEIHNITYFLPWHRWYVLQYENFLRQLDCKITVPYWDWSIVAASPFKNDFWADTNGFGGNGLGLPPCVPTGPFSVKKNWKLVKSAGEGCLQRTFEPSTGIIPNVVQVAKILAKNVSSFSDFELMMRVNLHDVVHYAIGGTMITKDSASSPEFFPHHSFIDKIWTDWQAKSNFYKFHKVFLTQNNFMPGTNMKSVDFLNNDNLPGCVKIKYAPAQLGDWNELINKVKKIAEMNPVALDKIPSMASTNLSEKIFEVFNVGEEEQKRAVEMQEELKPKIMVKTAELKGKEKMMGFKEIDVKGLVDVID